MRRVPFQGTDAVNKVSPAIWSHRHPRHLDVTGPPRISLTVAAPIETIDTPVANRHRGEGHLPQVIVDLGPTPRALSATFHDDNGVQGVKDANNLPVLAWGR